MRPAGILKSHDLRPIFHGPLTSDLDQIIKVKVLSKVESQDLLSSKLIFHMRMYLYETSRNIQEPCHDDDLNYISRSTDYRLCPDYHGYVIFV